MKTQTDDERLTRELVAAYDAAVQADLDWIAELSTNGQGARSQDLNRRRLDAWDDLTLARHRCDSALIRAHPSAARTRQVN